jgi:aspartate carbamoyltransferase catalytic subunit
MPNRFLNRDIISMRTLPKNDIEFLVDYTTELKNKTPERLLQGRVLGSCFFEPSTRTRLSFESAMKKLGGDVVGFHDGANTSISKGESLQDTMRVMGHYVDAIVIRHPLDGAAALAAEMTDKPVINGGDGSNQHPTQTLLDLFSIKETQGRLENLSIAFVGDLKYGRAVHSLVQACALFKTRMYFVSPSSLDLPKSLMDELKANSIIFSIHSDLASIMPKLDVIYSTRIQQERFPTQIDYQREVQPYSISLSVLEKAQPHLKILHPLPRLLEINQEVDKTPYAYYFQQSQNGVYVRQALLSLLLGKTV